MEEPIGRPTPDDRYNQYRSLVMPLLKKLQYVDINLSYETIRRMFRDGDMCDFRARAVVSFENCRPWLDVEETNEYLDLVDFDNLYVPSCELDTLRKLKETIKASEATRTEIFLLKKTIEREWVFGNWYARFCAEEWIASTVGLKWHLPQFKSLEGMLEDVDKDRREYVERLLKSEDRESLKGWKESQSLLHVSGKVDVPPLLQDNYVFSQNEHPFSRHPTFAKGRQMDVEDVSDMVNGLLPHFKKWKTKQLREFAIMKKDFLDRFMTDVVSSPIDPVEEEPRGLQEAYASTGMTQYAGVWLHPASAGELDVMMSRLDVLLQQNECTECDYHSYLALNMSLGSWTPVARRYHKDLMEFIHFGPNGRNGTTPILLPLISKNPDKIMTPEALWEYTSDTLTTCMDLYSEKLYDVEAEDVDEEDLLHDLLVDYEDEIVYGLVTDVTLPLSCDRIFTSM